MLTLALVEEPVHSAYLFRLVVPSEQTYPSGPQQLHAQYRQQGLQRAIAPVHDISQKDKLNWRRRRLDSLVLYDLQNVEHVLVLPVQVSDEVHVRIRDVVQLHVVFKVLVVLHSHHDYSEGSLSIGNLVPRQVRKNVK